MAPPLSSAGDEPDPADAPGSGHAEPERVEVRVAVADAGSAKRIAGDLVARELVSSVHVLGPMASIYFWGGAVHQTEEWLLLADTTTSHLPRVTALVRELHTYEIPEIIAIQVLDAGGEGAI